MKALVVTKAGSAFENFELVQDIPKPSVEKNELLIKVEAAALNPVDWKVANSGWRIKQYPCVLGGDAAGVVEAVGPEVKHFKVGDAVYGFTNIGDSRGSFAEYCVLIEDICGLKPSQISFAEAATLPIGLYTAAVAIYYVLLNNKSAPFVTKDKKFEDEYFLVWGGSSSVGAYAVQLAAALGFKVITTCSPSNFQLVKSLGAAQAFNYRDADVVEQIRKYTGGTLKYSFDCIGTPSIDLCTQCSSTEQPAQVAYITGSPTVKPSNVTHHYILLLHCFEEDLALQTFLRDFLTNIAYPRLIDGSLKANVVEKLPKGLLGVPEGLKLLAENKVSAKKLVAVISETP